MNKIAQENPAPAEETKEQKGHGKSKKKQKKKPRKDMTPEELKIDDEKIKLKEI